MPTVLDLANEWSVPLQKTSALTFAGTVLGLV